MKRAFTSYPLLVCGLLLVLLLASSPPALHQQRVLAQTTPEPSNNLPVSAATYLGGSGEDSASAVAIGQDGSILLAGSFPGYTPAGVEPLDLPGVPGGGDGALLRLNADGSEVLSMSRMGGSINDLEVDSEGRILVCGDSGLALLSSDARSVLWSQNPGSGTKCSLDQSGNTGTSAVLVGNAVFVYSSTGEQRGTWTIDRVAQNVAVDGTNSLVIVSGYEQKSANLQVAFLQAWSYTGTLAWTSYDFSAGAASDANLGADTRGEVVAIGQDGMLYFAGTINGGTGASIFSRDPKDMSQQANAVAFDNYSRATNVGSVKMTWYGRYNPADGSLVVGQSLLTRLSSGRGNSISPNEITADAEGRVFLAGQSFCCLRNRDERQIAGTTVGNYEGGEGFLLVMQPDLQQRLIWTPFSQPGVSAGGSPAVGVATRGGRMAVALTLNPKNDGERGLITHQALQAQPATLPDAYVAVWPFAVPPEPVDITVEAGPDQEVLAGQSGVELVGSGENVSTYRWMQLAGPTVELSTPDQATATFTAPLTETVLTFELRGSDDQTNSVTDSVTVAVLPLIVGVEPPAPARPGQVNRLESTVQSPNAAPIERYQWSLTDNAGLTVSLGDTTRATLEYTVTMQPGLHNGAQVAQDTQPQLVFELTAGNSLGSATTPVTVPVALEDLSLVYLPFVRK